MPLNSARATRARSFSSKSIYRSASQTRRKQNFKKEVLKTVTVEVETTSIVAYPPRPDTAASNSTAVSFVTLIWSTSLKSRWQDEMIPGREAERTSSEEKEVVGKKSTEELPTKVSSIDYKDDRSTLNLNSGWIPDWDAKFRTVGRLH
jgi:hypothetical protein